MKTGIFEDVVVAWPPGEGGQEYTIKSHRMMGALARIEDVITLAELTDANRRAPLGKIASAFGSLLRYAGARGVKDEEVYEAIFPDPNNAQHVQEVVTQLLMLMVPPSARQKAISQDVVDAEDEGEGEGEEDIRPIKAAS